MSKREINESQKTDEILRKADMYFKQYRTHCEAFEKSLFSKTKRGGVDQFDVWALGQQLEQFEGMVKYMQEAGNVNDLGVLPLIGYDVITAVQGTSILPVIMATQPTDEERGVVWFRQTRAGTTRGNLTAGQVTVDPRQQVKTPVGYASGKFANVVAATTVATDVTYSFTLAGAPVKSQSFAVQLGTSMTPTVYGRDQGSSAVDPNVGIIMGVGISGTINYTTGAVDLTLAADPGAGQSVIVGYQQNFEASADLPSVGKYFASKEVNTNIYALKGIIGMLESYQMHKRFNMNADDVMAKLLIEELTRELGGDAVSILNANAQGTATQFSLTIPAGVSEFAHRQSWGYRLAEAESGLSARAGRGTINRLILGKNHAAFVSQLPGFKKLYDGNSQGAHVFGELENQGIVVVRVNETAILPDNEGIAIWHNTTNPFDSAGVYMPYMPVTMTDKLPTTTNPLIHQRGVAAQVGMDVMIPNFITKFNLVA